MENAIIVIPIGLARLGTLSGLLSVYSPEQGRIAVDDRADVQIVNVSREPLAVVVSGAGTFAAHMNG